MDPVRAMDDGKRRYERCTKLELLAQTVSLDVLIARNSVSGDATF